MERLDNHMFIEKKIDVPFIMGLNYPLGKFFKDLFKYKLELLKRYLNQKQSHHGSFGKTAFLLLKLI